MINANDFYGFVSTAQAAYGTFNFVDNSQVGRVNEMTRADKPSEPE